MQPSVCIHGSLTSGVLLHVLVIRDVLQLRKESLDSHGSMGSRSKSSISLRNALAMESSTRQTKATNTKKKNRNEIKFVREPWEIQLRMGEEEDGDGKGHESLLHEGRVS